MMEKGTVIISKYGIELKAIWSDARGGFLPGVKAAAGKVFPTIDCLKEFFIGYMRGELQKAVASAKLKAMNNRMAFSKTEYLVALECYGRYMKEGNPDAFLWKYVIDHFESCFTADVLARYRKEGRMLVRRLSNGQGGKTTVEKVVIPEEEENSVSNGAYRNTKHPMPDRRNVSRKDVDKVFSDFCREHSVESPLVWGEMEGTATMMIRNGRMVLALPLHSVVSVHEIKRSVPTLSVSCADGFTYHLKLFGKWSLKTFNRSRDKPMKKMSDI